MKLLFPMIISIFYLITPINLLARSIEDSLVYYENSEGIDLMDLFQSKESDLIFRYEPLTKDSYGFLDNRFLGDKNSYYINWNGSTRSFNYSLNNSKIAGERWNFNKQKYSLSFNWRDYNFYLGDFKTRIANGNLISNSFRRSKFLVNIESKNKFWFDRSKSHLNQFRGLGVDKEHQLGKIIIQSNLIYSISKRPANNNSEQQITSLYTSNRFRTQNEINKVNQLTENIISGGISLRRNSTYLNYQFLNYQLDENVNLSSNYYFKNDNGTIHSISFLEETLKYKYNLEGNFTINNLNTLTIQANNQSYYIYFRYLSNKNNNPYSNLIKEYSNGKNEVGFLIGSRFNLNKAKCRIYFDVFNRPQLESYLINNNGVEIGLDVNINISRSSHRLNLVSEVKSDYSKSEIILPYTREKIRLRTDHKFKLSKHYNLKLQLNINYLKEESSPKWGSGILVKQTLNYNDIKIRLNTGTFRSEYFQNAIWWFDYFGRFNLQSFPMYGSGIYISSQLDYKFTKDINLQIAISYLKKEGVKEIGSYLDEIKGNERIRTVLQFNYSL